MCFVIHPDYPKTKTARKDIICFKMLQRFTNRDACKEPTSRATVFKSPFRNVRYDLGQTCTAAIKRDSFVVNEIAEGLHSYTTWIRAKNCCSREYFVFKSIIPKGFKYYYNPRNQEYVSTGLKVLEYCMPAPDNNYIY